MSKKKKKNKTRRNFVSKHMNMFCKSSVVPNKKRYKRKAKHKKDSSHDV